MLRPDAAMEIIERLLADGVDRRDDIIDAVAEEISESASTLRRLAADKVVSLALASMRDVDGNRLAFPSRNSDGKRVVVHVNYTTDARAMYEAGDRLEHVGKSMVTAGQRLKARAIQLGLFGNAA